MDKSLQYCFEDISIVLHTASLELPLFFDEFTFIRKGESLSGKRIALTFEEVSSLEPYISMLPEDAVLKTEQNVLLNGERRFTIHTASDGRRYYYYENYGFISIDPIHNEIQSFCCAKACASDIIPFIVLVIHPLIRVLENMSYQFLHAACVRVNGKTALITGLSGRGKSTATFALISRGHIALTDEVTLIRSENGQFSACTLTKWIKISKAAKERFFRADIPYIPLEEDCIVKLRDLFSEPVTKLTGIRHIFILEQTGKQETFIRNTHALSVLPELLPSSINMADRQSAENSLSVILGLLESLQCHKVFFGTDMEQFAIEVEKTLAEKSGDACVL